MTTGELIVLLQKYPTNTRVVVDGYEGGFEDVAGVQQINVDVDANMQQQPLFSGTTRPAFDGAGRHAASKSGIAAVYIRREDWKDRSR